MFLYPVRGINGFEVPFLKMTESGAEFDRLWVIVNSKTLDFRNLTKCDKTIQFESQYIWEHETPVTLRISCGGESIDVPLEREYHQKDYF